MFRFTAPVAAIALAVCTGLGAAVAAAPAALAAPRTVAQNVNAPSVAADPPPEGSPGHRPRQRPQLRGHPRLRRLRRQQLPDWWNLRRLNRGQRTLNNFRRPLPTV